MLESKTDFRYADWFLITLKLLWHREQSYDSIVKQWFFSILEGFLTALPQLVQWAISYPIKKRKLRLYMNDCDCKMIPTMLIRNLANNVDRKHHPE